MANDQRPSKRSYPIDGVAVRALREERCMTVGALACRVGVLLGCEVNPRSLLNAEAGSRGVSPARAHAIAQALGVPVAAITAATPPAGATRAA